MVATDVAFAFTRGRPRRLNRLAVGISHQSRLPSRYLVFEFGYFSREQNHSKTATRAIAAGIKIRQLIVLTGGTFVAAGPTAPHRILTAQTAPRLNNRNLIQSLSGRDDRLFIEIVGQRHHWQVRDRHRRKR